MKASDFQLYGPFVSVILLLALLSPRILGPRRLRVGKLWFGPAFMLTGILCYYVTAPAPTLRHGLVLAWALVLGAVIGWIRAKLVLVEIDSETGSITQRATPFGLYFLAALIALRSGLGILAVRHPELGIDLRDATDVLMFFGFGLLSVYASKLRVAAGRARRMA